MKKENMKKKTLKTIKVKIPEGYIVQEISTFYGTKPYMEITLINQSFKELLIEISKKIIPNQ